MTKYGLDKRIKVESEECNILRIKKSVLFIITAFVLSMAVLSTGCGTQKATTAEEKYIPVEVQMAGKSTLVETSVFSGKVAADQSAGGPGVKRRDAGSRWNIDHRFGICGNRIDFRSGR